MTWDNNTAAPEPKPNPRHLTEADVVEIRLRYDAGGVSYGELAAEFGTAPSNIGKIVRGRSWKDAGGPTAEDSRRATLTEAEVVEIRVRYAGGELQRGLAKEFGVTQTAIGKIVRGRRRSRAGGPIKGSTN